MILAFFACLFALALLARLLSLMILNALPLFCALEAGLHAHRLGLGGAGAALVALLAAIVLLAAARTALLLARTPAAAAGLGLCFAIPSALAGFHVALGLWGLMAPVSAAAWSLALLAGLYYAFEGFLQFAALARD